MHIHLNSKQTNRNKRNSLIKEKILTTPTHLYKTLHVEQESKSQRKTAASRNERISMKN